MDSVDCISILNIDNEKSTISSQQLITNEPINDEQYIVSDTDEELLILIQFVKEIELKSIKIHYVQNSVNKIVDEDIDISGPKDVLIYKILDLNINFDDLLSIQPDKSIKCNIKKLEKGQNISLQKTSKSAIKFKKIKYLAIYVKTNQKNTENTIINGIKFKINAENNNNSKEIVSNFISNESKEEQDSTYLQSQNIVKMPKFMTG
eukprot:448585_1